MLALRHFSIEQFLWEAVIFYADITGPTKLWWYRCWKEKLEFKLQCQGCVFAMWYRESSSDRSCESGFASLYTVDKLSTFHSHKGVWKSNNLVYLDFDYLWDAYQILHIPFESAKGCTLFWESGVHLVMHDDRLRGDAGKQKLIDDISLHLGLCLKPSKVEDRTVSAVSNVDSIIWAIKCIKKQCRNMMLKRVGARTHPCFTQFVTGKAMELSPLSCTFVCMLSWNCLMVEMNFLGEPYFAMILQRLSLLTISNALVRST